MVVNESGIRPAGHTVLVYPEAVEHTTASGIVLSTSSQAAREEMAQVDGFLVAVGPTSWSDQPAPYAVVGERVMFGKYKGIVREGKDGKKYRIINDLDIVAVLED